MGKGIFFSILISARSVHTDADKAVLARLESPATAGAYTAAYRLVSMACIPIAAMQFSLQARVFRKGSEAGVAGALGVVRRLLLVAGAYCTVLAVAIYVAAPAVPWLLGDSYQLATDMLRWLCLLPFLLVLQWVVSDTLAGADAQRLASSLHALTAAISIALNLLLVPAHGWLGAVIAAYAAQAFLTGSLLFTVFRGLQAQRRAAPA
jgi:O-antigen/teichoic acid export membrane protein